MNVWVLKLLRETSLLFYLSRKLNLLCEQQNFVVQSLKLNYTINFLDAVIMH